MNDEHQQPPESSAKLESEIRKARKFTAEEAIARLAGPGAMKGGSAISRQQQAENAVATWLAAHITEDTGSLKLVLTRQITGSAALHDDIERPLLAIATCLDQILGSDELLREVVREADVEWGRLMDERPHFERDSIPPHPDDPYTIESVRAALRAALVQLPEAAT